MEEQGDSLERDHALAVVLPGGLEKNATVHGSKPVMDVLVTLCASYHLNPSDYTVEVLSDNKNNISFKPNSPIGSLEADKIVLKPKGVEEKIRRPYMPEASVRLLINYNRTHKTVVRVSPTVPLEMLLPAICDKCEFGVPTTVLLRDPGSDQPLDTSRTLKELGLRELFAKDTNAREPVDLDRQAVTPEAAVTPTKVVSPPPGEELPKVEKKPKKNTGFLSLFRKGKKKPETEGAPSAPVSPSPHKQAGSATNGQVSSASSGPADMQKKRRAPPPPVTASQSVPADLSTCYLGAAQVGGDVYSSSGGSDRSASTPSTLRSTKRRAPPPPRTNPNLEMRTSAEVEDSLSTLEEHLESDESVSINLTPSPPRSSPEPRHLRFSSSSTLSSLHDMVDPYLPSFGGKDLSDARSALAKVLTSSASRGALVRRLKSSAAIPKLGSGSALTPETRGGFDGGGVWNLDSVPPPGLPTQPEWEEPVHRVAMTTFKVVPSKPTGSDPVVLGQTEVDDEPSVEGSPDPETEPPGRSSLEACSQEDPGPDGLPSLPPSPHSEGQVCPDSPPTEEEEVEDGPEVTAELVPAQLSECDALEALTEEQIESAEQREGPQSPTQSGGADEDPAGPNADETDAEAVDDGVDEALEEDAFPPPPSPVFFTEDTNSLDKFDEAPQASCSPSSSQPPSPTSTGPDGAPGQDLQEASQLPEPTPEPLVKTDAGPSRFAEAVAMAVQKSRLQRQGNVLGLQASSGPPSDPPSPFYI